MARVNFAGAHKKSSSTTSGSVDEDAAEQELKQQQQQRNPDAHGLGAPPRAESNISKPTKRLRWATQRATGQKAAKKRMSIMQRLHKNTDGAEEKRHSTGSTITADGEPQPPPQVVEQEGGGRTVYFNIPVPDDAKDGEGNLKVSYPRNKIRTAKYTPLSFLPKNLWFQFHNIANVYFLFIIILSIFSIFGATNPGLSAVPLIVIVCITAVKDAIEDWRRTVLDNELNNSPIHRLVDWNNVNSQTDNVSLWRRIKKATTKFIIATYRGLKGGAGRKKSDEEKGPVEEGDGTRPSIETRRTSIFSGRTSFHSVRSHLEDGLDGIQMTPVQSPNPANGAEHKRSSYFKNDEDIAPPTSKRVTHEIAGRDYGNIIDIFKHTPGKARFKKDYWKNVNVGDFVRIYNDEEIPADVVVLATSDPDGACYVETKNLDGETNLKVRQALNCARKVKHAKDCERSEFIIESEPPHANLYNYSGVIKWEQRDQHNPEAPRKPMAEPISISNILLRGCSIRNTEWALGIVLFTGLETKIMLNSGVTPSKRARMAKDLNWNVIYNFIILFFMCFISGLVQGITWSEGNNSLDFFEFGSIGGTSALDGFITFWTCIILFQNLVPISLYISLEIIRTAQAFFIYSDTFMYYEKLDYPCTPKSWNISDDLGQIEYIFSDKTGTLTQNVMEFKKCTINGVPYGEAYTEAQMGLQRRLGVDVEEESARAREQIAADRIKMLASLRKIHDNPFLHDNDLTFVASDFVEDLSGRAGEEQKRANEHFMLVLALCHTVITERHPGDPPKIEFKAQSPDEAALVATARDCGFTVLGRSGDDILLNIMGEDRSYTILNTLEFNSTRKRMSAIVRMPDGTIRLFCKGADSMIYSRLASGKQQALRKQTAEHLEMFAREGLRTLCIAEKILPEDVYQEWNKQHDLAAQAVHQRDERLEEVSDAIERDLMLLGGTAIEDRLQDGVPDTIALLGEAGIKVWVLTGDKVETAINIGFSCNLLSNEMELIVLKIDDESIDSAEAELDHHLLSFGMTGSDEELAAARKNHEPPDATHALVIDGDTLKLVLDERIRQKFLLLCKQCRSVLCCRVSPAQKAAVVQLVRSGLNIMALAIGDGANDVAMIQEADVGVGIAGEEGRQAVMSSDYAIGQFRFLQRLVLVHGRWSYRRLAETIANFFYKNMVWTFALFWYQISNNFDGSYLFDYSYILLVNLAFSSLPVILMGILDQDVNDKVSLAVPQLYRRGIERKEWTQKKFWLYMLDGIYQSTICFFMAFCLFAPAVPVTANGLGIDDRPRVGVFVACPAIVVMNTYILMNTYRWDWVIVLVTVISTLLIFFWTGVYTSFEASVEFYKGAAEVYGTLGFWCILLLTVICCLLPRFLIKSIQKIYKPRDVDIIREQIRQGKFDYLNAFEAYVPPKAATPSTPSEPSSVTIEQKPQAKRETLTDVPEDMRPIYPPSVAPTATTHNPRSQNGSDGTGWSGRRSTDHINNRLSVDRARPSFDRARHSMDKLRSSFEASHDFTSAARLTKLESSHSGRGPGESPAPATRVETR